MALSLLQLTFLAKRLLCKTDDEAAALVGIRPEAAYRWKTGDPEFRERYDALGTDGIELAKAILRQQLGEAANVLAEGMRANRRDRADHAVRVGAAKIILGSHGVVSERREVSGPGGGAIPVQLTADDLREAAKRARQAPAEGDEQ